jgi:hypothetical protein
MRTAGVKVLAAALVGLAAIGCGHASEPRPVTYSAHGLVVELPPGWQPASASLTPQLLDPREELSVGTFPLRYRETACAHMPSSALDDLGPTDAFVTIQERGVDPGSTWQGFPARPPHFGPKPEDASEAAQCVPDARFADHWFTFTDGDRHFHVLVAFGPQASAATRDEAWGILDSLRVDPQVRPDWSSAG